MTVVRKRKMIIINMAMTLLTTVVMVMMKTLEARSKLAKTNNIYNKDGQHRT